MKCPICHVEVPSNLSNLNFCPNCNMETPFVEWFLSEESYNAWDARADKVASELQPEAATPSVQVKEQQVVQQNSQPYNHSYNQQYTPTYNPYTQPYQQYQPVQTSAKPNTAAQGFTAVASAISNSVTHGMERATRQMMEQNVGEDVLFDEGYKCYQEGKYDAARRLFENGISKYPASARLHFWHLLSQYKIKYIVDSENPNKGYCTFIMAHVPSIKTQPDYECIKILAQDSGVTDYLDKLDDIERQRVEHETKTSANPVVSTVTTPVASVPPSNYAVSSTPSSAYMQPTYVQPYYGNQTYQVPGVNGSVGMGSNYSDKSLSVAILLCLLLGWLGIHRFYARRYVIGVLYLFTMGLGGIGIWVDLILLLTKHFKDDTGRVIGL